MEQVLSVTEFTESLFRTFFFLFFLAISQWSSSRFGDHEHLKGSAIWPQGVYVTTFPHMQVLLKERWTFPAQELFALVQFERSQHWGHQTQAQSPVRTEQQANPIIFMEHAMIHVAAKQQSYFPPCNYLQQHFLTCPALPLHTPPHWNAARCDALTSATIKYDMAQKALN